jgi:RNA polymerase sigma-B factor
MARRRPVYGDRPAPPPRGLGSRMDVNDEAWRRREPDLWRRWSEDRDLDAREELVGHYLPVARRTARRYAGVAEPYDDLAQVASLALLKAVDRFDPSLGTPFLGYAKPTILGELKRHFRDKVWMVRAPRSLHDLLLRVERASEDLTLETGRVPTVAAIAARLEVEPSDVLEALEFQHDRSPVSLDLPPKDAGEDGWTPEWLGTEDGRYEDVEDRVALLAALATLEAREAEILRLRFFDELPQVRIAERLGCSQMQVSRVLRRALEGLRQEMRDGRRSA